MRAAGIPTQAGGYILTDDPRMAPGAGPGQNALISGQQLMDLSRSGYYNVAGESDFDLASVLSAALAPVALGAGGLLAPALADVGMTAPQVAGLAQAVPGIVGSAISGDPFGALAAAAGAALPLVAGTGFDALAAGSPATAAESPFLALEGIPPQGLSEATGIATGAPISMTPITPFSSAFPTGLAMEGTTASALGAAAPAFGSLTLPALPTTGGFDRLMQRFPEGAGEAFGQLQGIGEGLMGAGGVNGHPN